MFSAKELAPTEDQGGLFVIITSPPEATLEYRVQQGEKIAQALKGFSEADYVWQVIFGGGAFGGVELQPWKEPRTRTTQEMLGEAFGRVGAIPGVQAFPVLPPSLPGAGQFDVELLVTSPDEARDMAPIAGALVTAAFESGLFMFAESDLKIDMPQARVVIDRTKVADLGLDLATVGQQLATMLAGGYVNRFNFEGRSYKVIPQVELRDRATAERLLDLKLAVPTGQLIPVSSFASIASEVAPRSLNRFQQRNSVKISGGVVPGVTKEQALTALEKRARELLPPGYALDFAGESRQIRQEGSQLVGTLGFALALIYLVLAAQFASFRDPLIVLAGSVPLALSGALVFTFLGLTTINIYTQVGLITLVGLVAKNGILIVEWANHLREHGADKLAAIREASLTRLRPVLMTSAATVFGHLPLVMVSGPGAEARNSIGIVLVTGMTIGTIFTLFVVPVLYTLIASRHEALAPLPGDADASGSAPAPSGEGARPVLA
jgi:multidrug efflux pump